MKKKNIFSSKLILLTMSILVLVVPFIVTAAWTPQQITFDPGQNVLRNTNLGDNDPVAITGSIINWLLTLLGVVAVSLLIYGGIIWMLSTGNEQEVEKARDIIAGAAIGLVIIFSSYAISQFVFDNLLKATGA